MSKKKWLRFFPVVAIAVLIIAAIIGGLYLKSHFHKDETQQKKMVQQITVLNPPPPPPPPPPPQEQIKEPEVKEEPIKEEAQTPPQDSPEQSAAPEASEGAGVGNDGFGLGKNTGRAWGGGVGGGYEQFVRQEVNELLADDPKLKHMAYVAVVAMTINEFGELSHIEVEQREGAPEVKALIEMALEKKRKLSKPRPIEAGDRITLRLKSVL